MRCALGDKWSADVGLICYRHHDRFVEMLDPRNTGSAFNPARPDDPRVAPSIPVLYRRLSLRRGSVGLAPVGPPAFGPSSPSDDHVIVLRDARSRSAVFGPDDVEHAPRPPVLVLGVLAERLRARPQGWDVAGLSSVLHGSMRRLAEQSWVWEAYRELRAVSGALRAANGDPPSRSIGTCRTLVDDEGREDRTGKWRCAVPLYPPEPVPRAADEPVPLPALRCTSCGHRYTGSELIEIARNPLAAPSAAAS